jgi:chromosome segregation ATPase
MQLLSCFNFSLCHRHDLLQEAELIRQNSVLESRIRVLNEEAEVARVQEAKLHKRIEFLEERAAESSSINNRQTSTIMRDAQQLQSALHSETQRCKDLVQEVEELRKSFDSAEQAKQVGSSSLSHQHSSSIPETCAHLKIRLRNALSSAQTMSYRSSAAMPLPTVAFLISHQLIH